MPASRSLSRDAKSAPRSRSYWPLVLAGLAAMLAVVISAVPASIVTRFLPPEVHAEDFSGSIWHGSAGKIRVDGRDAGALEWRLHPAALLRMQLSADVNWVKVAFVVDAAVEADRQGFSAHDVKGGGPIEDLRDFGVAAGWRGIADIKLSEGAVAADGSMTAQLTDTGGPLDVKAVITLSTKERTGILAGTLRERPEASATLLSDLEGIVQLRGRDPQGRIPVDLEFTW